MASRFLAHVRQQWIGVLALLLVLTGGTAYALDGSNTVFSDDIVNGEVRTDDLAANSVGSGKIADQQVKNADLSLGASSSNTIADNGVQGIDIKNGDLTGADVADTDSLGSPEVGGLTGADVADNDSLGSPEIGPLGGEDISLGSITDFHTSGLVPYDDVLWAVVNSDGSVNRASVAGTTSALEDPGTGDYEVLWSGESLDPCASIAQISDSSVGFGGLSGQAASAQGEDFSSRIDVRTFNSAGAPADRGFTVFVLCPE